jgi:catechol 2,3-dioxygenase-like lactoylglutathione lyase family enzyme
MSDSTPVLGQLTPMLPAGKDMEAAIIFYEQKLGFAARYKDDDMVILQRGATEIMLQNNDDPHTASQTSLRIQVSGVDTLYNEYHAQDIPPFHEVIEGEGGLGNIKATPWGTREFAVRDLAGVCITFYERQS